MMGNAAELDGHRQTRLEHAHVQAAAETASDAITVRAQSNLPCSVKLPLFECTVTAVPVIVCITDT